MRPFSRVAAPMTSGSIVRGGLAAGTGIALASTLARQLATSPTEKLIDLRQKDPHRAHLPSLSLAPVPCGAEEANDLRAPVREGGRKGELVGGGQRESAPLTRGRPGTPDLPQVVPPLHHPRRPATELAPCDGRETAPGSREPAWGGSVRPGLVLHPSAWPRRIRTKRCYCVGSRSPERSGNGPPSSDGQSGVGMTPS